MCVHVWVTDLEPALPTNRMLEYFIVYFVGMICFLAANVTLTSLDGAQAACLGEVITYTCTALRTNAIEWIVTPGVSSATFFQDSTITERTIEDFHLALTIRIPNGTGTSDLTSTLTVNTTASQNGTIIQCVSAHGRAKLELSIVTSKLCTFLLTHELTICNAKREKPIENFKLEYILGTHGVSMYVI